MPLLIRKSEAKRRQLASGFAKGWGTSHDGKRQQRALLASATTLMSSDGANRNEAKRLTKLRQPWQEDAWAYRDAIGELRYATTFLGNALRKIKLVPSAYVEDELEPLPLSEIPDCPPEVIAAANDALYRLSSGGPLALGGILRDIAENFEVAGECFLIGWPPNTMLPDGDNPSEVWEIRSVSEITASNDGVLQLKLEGSTGGNDFPDGVFVQRLWYPHPRKKDLADSPFAAILDVCEELLILSRDIRASGRSRLANSGLLLIPDGLTVVKASTTEDANDSEQDEFMSELIQAAMMAIQDEGSASAVVPIVVRGPADQLAAVKTVTISRPEVQRGNQRQELITRMATSLDLPAEVLTGKGDLNHWTAWAVDDDTFSEHVEPLVMVIDDALTAGYYRTALKLILGEGNPWVDKIILWHDATRIVRHPDRSQDALQAYDRFALSDAALRDTMGFSDTEAPDNTELLTRVMMKQSRLDPTIAAQILKRMDNTLDISQVKPGEPGRQPGEPDEAEQGTGPVGPQPLGAPAPTQAEGPPQNGQPKQAQAASAASANAASNGVMPPFAKGELSSFMNSTDMMSSSAQFAQSIATDDGPTKASINKGGRKLARTEKQLNARLHQAANDTMTRALEKAGARIRTAASKTAAGRAQVSTYSNLMLCFKASHSLIAAAGLDEQQLLAKAWEELQEQWDDYLEWGRNETVDAIADMLKKPHAEFEALANNLAESADHGWAYLAAELQKVAHGYLTADQIEVADTSADDDDDTATKVKVAAGGMVPFGLIRKALKFAGGTQHPAADTAYDPTIAVEIPSGLTSGPLVSQTLADNDVNVSKYTWVHGYTPNAFEPHEDLDGIEFDSWTDDVLANNGEWPDVPYFAPGDHDGCTCDFEISWSAPQGEDTASDTSEAEEPESVAASSAQFGGPGSGPQGGRHEKDSDTKTAGSSNYPDTPEGRAQQVSDAMDLGMSKQTAEKLQAEGSLDDAMTLAQTQQDPETVDNARSLANDRYQDAASRVTPEDKARAEERHARSKRAGGDDRPGAPRRRALQQKLVDSYGDGKTAPCIYCERSLQPSTTTLERLVPGSEGGPYREWNLAPACYGCNNERSDAPFEDASSTWANTMMKQFADGDGNSNAQPIVPLGTFVTAKCIGYTHDDDPDAPTDIDVPLEEVSGTLDGYYVEQFAYFKYIVCGYDVDSGTIAVTNDDRESS